MKARSGLFFSELKEIIKFDSMITTLTKIESGVIKKPSVLLMAKIAKALGVSIEDLLK